LSPVHIAYAVFSYYRVKPFSLPTSAVESMQCYGVLMTFLRHPYVGADISA